MFQTISETVRNSNIKEKNVFLYEMIFYDTQVSNLNNSFYSPMSKYNIIKRYSSLRLLG